MDLVTLIIDGLPLSYTTSDLTALLSQFNDVLDCRIVRDPTGFSLGFGYAQFTSQNGAEQVRAALSGKHIGGGHELLIARVADSASRLI